MASIAIVDDEATVRSVLSKILIQGGHDVRVSSTLAEFLEIMKSESVEVALLDIHLPDGRGDEVMPDLLARDPYLRVVVVSGDPSVETVESAIKRGAFDYLTKPFNADALRHVVSQAVAARYEAINRAASERSPLRSVTSQRRLAGFSRQICAVNLAIERAAASAEPVLIEGESGTGKEMAAQAIHEMSARRKYPLVKVNCAAIPKPLAEGELFGTEMGALPDSKGTRMGMLELAERGAIFLDEIGDLDVTVQAKLLHFLRDQTITRVGGDNPRRIDVRIIAATTGDIRRPGGRAPFMPDLYQILSINTIEMPPLRIHPDDIEHLAYVFLREKSLELNRKVYNFSEEVLDFFRSYSWPGNVRELRSMVERLVILSDPDRMQIDEEILRRYCFHYHPMQIRLAAGGAGNGSGSEGAREEVVTLEEMEKDYLRRALRTLDFNKTQCAAALGISRSTLQRKIQQYGLE
jgi:DNA-binding NtrC family response regulator